MPKSKYKYTADHVRTFVLSDETLYQQAREFGGGGAEEMYANLDRFVRENRQRLDDYIDRLTIGRLTDEKLQQSSSGGGV